MVGFVVGGVGDVVRRVAVAVAVLFGCWCYNMLLQLLVAVLLLWLLRLVDGFLVGSTAIGCQ